MVNLIIFIMVSLSIVNIILNETIFSFFRVFLNNKFPKIYKFISCQVCFSWWIGIFLSFFITIYGGFIINLFVCAFVSSIVNKLYVELMPDKFGMI